MSIARLDYVFYARQRNFAECRIFSSTTNMGETLSAGPWSSLSSLCQYLLVRVDVCVGNEHKCFLPPLDAVVVVVEMPSLEIDQFGRLRFFVVCFCYFDPSTESTAEMFRKQFKQMRYYYIGPALGEPDALIVAWQSIFYLNRNEIFPVATCQSPFPFRTANELSPFSIFIHLLFGFDLN